MSLKIVFCWSDISGYMAACWRALQQLQGFTLHIIAFQAHSEAPFSEKLMEGISCRLLDLQERNNSELIKQLVLAQSPDVVVISGWFHPPYRQLPFATELNHTHFVMGMDTPWRDNLRQRLARWKLRSYLRRMSRVVVTGERSWQYARYLGVAPRRIARGLYGIDFSQWAALQEKRLQHEWPRGFLFVGRYVEVKAIDILVAAYRQYRDLVEDPWPLVCCGQGKFSSYLQEQPGIEDRGFVPPNELWSVWTNAGVFLLPSRRDPWPLALVEAAAAGLPILCTNACGSAVEVVRDSYNGFIVPEDDVSAFANALVSLHRNYDQLPEWGARSQQLAAPYAAEVWAEKWRTMLQSLPAMSV